MPHPVKRSASASLSNPSSPDTPFEKWVVCELATIKGDVRELKDDVRKLLHHLGVVSGGQT